jgi:hypothetical protein
MDRYIVFAGRVEDSGGGANDIIGTSNDFEPAKKIIEDWLNRLSDKMGAQYKDSYFFGHVYDVDEKKIIFEK